MLANERAQAMRNRRYSTSVDKTVHFSTKIRKDQIHEGQRTLIWEQIPFRKWKLNILHPDESEDFCCLADLSMKRAVFSTSVRVVLDAVDVFHYISLLEILEEIHFLI